MTVYKILETTPVKYAERTIKKCLPGKTAVGLERGLPQRRFYSALESSFKELRQVAAWVVERDGSRNDSLTI